MNPLAPKIDNPLAAAASHPLVAATKEQMAVTTKQPLVEYVRRSLELEDPEEIDRRADELTVIGYEKTADHLREHAGALRARAAAPAGDDVYRSPIPEASDEQWARFVRLMQAGDVAAVTPSGQVGIFQTRLKRLQDLGLARDVRRVNGEGGARWTATFRPPLTLARLLADPLLQYRIFVASMRRYRERDPGASTAPQSGRRSRASPRRCPGCSPSPTTPARRSRPGWRTRTTAGASEDDRGLRPNHGGVLMNMFDKLLARIQAADARRSSVAPAEEAARREDAIATVAPAAAHAHSKRDAERRRPRNRSTGRGARDEAARLASRSTGTSGPGPTGSWVHLLVRFTGGNLGPSPVTMHATTELAPARAARAPAA